ncbi:MAG: hypothetical protein IT372_29750 [Polyangiaceae bacterium]|nr:hypothetical protein [Polyangiaceae bacterium]
MAIPALWYAIHEIPGFGPAVVDGVRAVVGPGPIAWIEDTAYAAADRLNLLRYGDAPPKTFWTPPPPAPPPPSAPSAGDTVPASAAAPPDAFAPARFDPPFDRIAAEGDGVWTPMPDPVAPRDPPVLWKSVVHPDPRRGFAAVAIVAIDLERVDLRLVAGTHEPASSTVPGERRPGLVPADQTPDLIAAFNGGFKAMHGNYGMMLGGETFLPPRDIACTVALYKAGPIRIRTWKSIKDTAADMAGYRQTPACLVEQGELNAALSESNRNWGATVSGETIIRRSALGLDQRGRVLFYGLGEAVTSQSLARAMKAAGAFDAAQLDVNYSYPRFLLYEKGAPGDPPHAASSLIPDVKFKPAEYVGEPSPRDFFYLLRKRSTS